MPFQGQTVWVALGRKCSVRSAPGGKYTFPSTRSKISLSASTAPFQIARTMTGDD